LFLLLLLKIILLCSNVSIVVSNICCKDKYYFRMLYLEISMLKCIFAAIANFFNLCFISYLRIGENLNIINE